MELNKVLTGWSQLAAKLFLGIFFAALIFYRPNFIQDYLTNAGWVYLSCLAFLFSVLLANRPTVVLPQKCVLLFGGAVIVLLFLTSAVNSATFLEERWTQRYLGVLLLFVTLQIFREENDVSKLLKLPISTLILFVCAEAIYQYLFLCEPNDPLGPSCYASRFWNINMLSQALALSIPFLLIFRKSSSHKIAWGFDLLISLSIITIFLTGCRSSLLALVAFFALQTIMPFVISRKRTLLILILAVIGFSPLYIHKRNTLAPFGEGKQGSAQYRLEVWKKTIEMSFDFPSGIGVNNFEFGFLPYKRESKIQNITWEVDKSPHNEFVRFLAEEGWIAFVFLLAGSVFLIVAISRSIFAGTMSFQQRFIVIALPEFIFQFPTEMFFPVFLFCIVLALEFAPRSQSVLFKPFFKTSLVAVSALVLSLFVVRNIQIVPPKYSVQFCSLFPDNWKMCGEYFKSHFDEGDLDGASATIQPVVRRQPFNFIALNFDYLLGDHSRNQTITCNYYALFNGKASIEGSDTSSCDASVERSNLLDSFIKYAEQR